jgi:hypothetical protein
MTGGDERAISTAANPDLEFDGFGISNRFRDVGRSNVAETTILPDESGMARFVRSL